MISPTYRKHKFCRKHKFQLSVSRQGVILLTAKKDKFSSSRKDVISFISG